MIECLFLITSLKPDAKVAKLKIPTNNGLQKKSYFILFLG